MFSRLIVSNLLSKSLKCDGWLGQLQKAKNTCYVGCRNLAATGVIIMKSEERGHTTTLYLYLLGARARTVSQKLGSSADLRA
jgi:hypothetical protein